MGGVPAEYGGELWIGRGPEHGPGRAAGGEPLSSVSWRDRPPRGSGSRGGAATRPQGFGSGGGGFSSAARTAGSRASAVRR